MSNWKNITEEKPPVGKSIMIYSEKGGVAEGQMESDGSFTQYRWNAKNVKATHWTESPEGPKKFKNLNLFVSQPMRGLTDEEIKNERERIIEVAKKAVRNHIGEDVELTVLDSFFEGAPADAKPLWYLGESLKLLGQADVAIFAKGWDKMRGCKIESTCAHEYDIPLVFEEREDGIIEVDF